MFLKIEDYSNQSESRERHLINSIFAIQSSNFKPGDMRDFSNNDFHDLVKLVIKLGSRIIKADLRKEGKLNSYPAAKKEFANIIHAMAGHANRFCFIRYAAQLIQYYTLLGDRQCDTQQNLQDFLLFLESKNVVNADMNLYIIEHQLLIIFKELNKLESEINRLPKESIDAKFLLIDIQLEKARGIIDDGKIDAPYNVFVFYLGFALNYSCLRAIEVYSTLSLSVREQTKISRLKRIYAEYAKADLDAIDLIQDECRQHEICYANGYEFSFGQDVFKKISVNSEQNVQNLMSCSKL